MTEPCVAHVVASAVPAVHDLAALIDVLGARGWAACVALTPTAAGWVDIAALERQTGRPVRTRQRRPGEVDPFPPPDAILAVLPFNTINAWAGGLNCNVALNQLNRAVGLGTPTIVAPVVDEILRRHPAYARNVELLVGAGVVLLNIDRVKVRRPGADSTIDWAATVAQLPR